MIPSTFRNNDSVISMRMHEHSSGYGVYIMILELMRDAENYSISSDPAKVAFAINEPDVELVSRVINNYGLFDTDANGYIYSEWLISSLQAYEDKKAATKAAAAKAAAARWGKKKETNAAAMQLHYDCIAKEMQTDANNNKDIEDIKENNQQNIQTEPKWFAPNGRWIFYSVLKNICRDTGEMYSKKRLIAEVPSDGGEYNINLCSDVALELRLTETQYKALVYMTKNGCVGDECTIAMLKAYKAVKSGEIKPKFPFNYVMSKMPNYDSKKAV